MAMKEELEKAKTGKEEFSNANETAEFLLASQLQDNKLSEPKSPTLSSLKRRHSSRSNILSAVKLAEIVEEEQELDAADTPKAENLDKPERFEFENLSLSVPKNSAGEPAESAQNESQAEIERLTKEIENSEKERIKLES